MRRWLFLFVALSLLTFPVLAQEADAAFFRVAHLSVDAPAVDIALSGESLWQELDFPDVTDWAQLNPGSYPIRITDPANSETPLLFTTTLTIASGEWVTLVIAGYAGRDALTLQTIVENYSTIERGEARITALHVVPDMPPVAVYADGVELAAGLGYIANASDGERFRSIDLVAGRYMLYALDDVGAELVATNDVTFGAQRAYLFVITGTPSNPQYVLVSTNPADVIGGEQAEAVVTGSDPLTVRVGHFAPGVPAVDLYLDGERLLPNLEYGELTGYITLDAGTYDAVLVPAGEALESAIYNGRIALVENTLTLVAAVGYEVDGTLTLVAAREEAEPLPPGLTRIAFFQAIRANSLFDLLLNDNVLIQGLAFPELFAGAGDGYVSVDMMPGSYRIAIASDRQRVEVGTIQTGAGRVYLVVALGTPDNPTYRLIPANMPE